MARTWLFWKTSRFFRPFLTGTAVLPNAFMALLSKLEYVMLKAEEVEEEVLDSLQALLQTNGVLRHLLNILEAGGFWEWTVISSRFEVKAPTWNSFLFFEAVGCFRRLWVMTDSICYMLWALGFHSIASTTSTNRHCRISDWQAQWKMNMEGKFVDLYKLPGAKRLAGWT